MNKELFTLDLYSSDDASIRLEVLELKQDRYSWEYYLIPAIEVEYFEGNYYNLQFNFHWWNYRVELNCSIRMNGRKDRYKDLQ